MTQRDVFPHNGDRRTIRAFLCGTAAAPLEQCSLVSIGHTLMWSTFGERKLLAWYDTAGALMMTLAPGVGERAADFILAELGIPDRIRREVEDTPHINRRGEHRGTSRRITYYVGDHMIESGQPFVLAGALTVQAYRAI